MTLPPRSQNSRLIVGGLLIAVALAVPLATTAVAAECCVQCTCVQLCCTSAVCGPEGGTVTCGGEACMVECRVYAPAAWACSDFC